MRFTEHELTAALTGTAKAVLAQQRKDVRKGKVDIETAWEELDRFQRYQLLDGLGTQILPVMIALPDIEVESGTRPSFTDAQVVEAVEAQVGDEGGRLRRKAVVAARVALVRMALGYLPPRLDPDALLHHDPDDLPTGDDVGP